MSIKFCCANAVNRNMSESLVSIESFSCHVCCELMFDPMTTSCGHAYCSSCIGKLESPRKCPDCRAPIDGLTSRNYFLRNIIESAFPAEYKRRSQQFDLDAWIEEKRKTYPTMELMASRMDVPTVMKVLGLLDDLQIWNRQYVPGFSVDFYTKFNKTCIFFFIPTNFEAQMGVSSFIVVSWGTFRIVIMNHGNEWSACE